MNRINTSIRILLLLMLTGLIATAVWFRQSYQDHLRESVFRDLEAISDSKVHNIASWYGERMADARIMCSSNPLTQTFGRIIRGEAQRADSMLASNRMQEFCQNNGYCDILLVDEAGQVAYSAMQNAETISEKTQALILKALDSEEPMLLDLHRDTFHDAIHASVLIGLRRELAGTGGVLVFLTEACNYLYPLIQDWPISSRSGEGLLIRRDADSVLFVSQLRFLKDAALNLRLPLDSNDLPASKVARGEHGRVEGRDYRGEEVLAYVQDVPQTPWYLVAKVDRREALSASRRDTILILLLLAFSFIAGLSGLSILWHRNQRDHLQRLVQTEEARQLGELRYFTTLESIAEAVITTDELGRIDYMNNEAERLTDMKLEEARGQLLGRVYTIIDETSGEATQSPDQRIFESRQAYNDEGHGILVSQRGVRCPVSESASPIRDTQNNISGVVLVFHDQTASRQAKRELELRERQNRHLFEEAPVGIFRTTSDGRILTINPAMAAILGYPDVESTLESIHDLNSQLYLHPERRDEFVTLLREKGAVEGFEYEAYRRDGSIVWLNMNARIAERLPDGNVVIEGFTTDIHEQKTAEQALRESEEQYRLLTETSLDVIWTMDPEFNFTYVNPAVLPLTGISPREWHGSNLADHCAAERFEEIQTVIKEAMQSRSITTGVIFETEILHKNGTPIPVEIHGMMICDDSGLPLMYQGITRDLTERRRSEAERERLSSQLSQAQKMESVGRLAGGVAHDFNNILQALLGYSQLLLDVLDPKKEEYEFASEIFSGATRAAGLTQQLLAFSRKQAISPRTLQLNELISGILKMLRRLIGEDVELVWKPRENLPHILMDPTQLNQILANLVVNARDAIPHTGCITIETNYARLDNESCEGNPGSKPGNFLVLTVSDTGMGMDQQTQKEIFDPFFTTKPKGKGTGLGLSTVYGIVQQNGGFISVYSEPGKGSTFRVYLPEHQGDEIQKKPAAKLQHSAPAGETILLVEDEAALLSFARRLLIRLGYKVLSASNPQDAIKQVRGYPGEIHLLMTDVVMPGMSGRELRDALLQLRPGLRCLYISGYTGDAIAHRGILEKDINFLPKPFTREELATKLREILESSSSPSTD